MSQDIIYTEKEKEIYKYLFNKYKSLTNENIDGSEVAILFKKGNLDKVKINFILFFYQ